MTWIVLAAIGACTYGLRVSMFVALRSRSIPDRIEVPLSLVGPAAIGGLLATMLLTSGGRISGVPLGELIAVGVAFLVVRRTQNVMHAMVVGLPIAWVLAGLGV